MAAAEAFNASQLGFLRCFQKDMLRRQCCCPGAADEVVGDQPLVGGGVQIMRFATVGCAGAVADHGRLAAVAKKSVKKLTSPGKRASLPHAGAIDISLQFSPGVILPGRLQGLPHVCLRPADRSINQTTAAA